MGPCKHDPYFSRYYTTSNPFMKGIPDKEDQEHTIRWNKKEYQPGKETTAAIVKESFFLAGHLSGNKNALSNPSQTMTTVTIQKSLRAYTSVHSASADPLCLSFREKILPVSFQQNLISFCQVFF